MNWRIVFLAVVLLGILFLTCQDSKGTIELSEGVREKINQLLHLHITPEQARHWAHMPEYFILGGAACLFFREPKKALFFCLIISLADEGLKVLLPTRHFDLNDLGWDAVGYVFGILL